MMARSSQSEKEFKRCEQRMAEPLVGFFLFASAGMFMAHTARAAAGPTVNQMDILKGDVHVAYQPFKGSREEALCEEVLRFEKLA